MSFTSATNSALPRLPVTWKEFSELLRANQESPKPDSDGRRVERVPDSRFSNVSAGSHDQAADEQMFGNQPGTWNATYKSDGSPAQNPCDSPHSSGYSEFDAYA